MEQPCQCLSNDSQYILLGRSLNVPKVEQRMVRREHSALPGSLLTSQSCSQGYYSLDRPARADLDRSTIPLGEWIRKS